MAIHHRPPCRTLRFTLTAGANRIPDLAAEQNGFSPTILFRLHHLLLLPRAKERGAVLLHPKKPAEVSGGFRKTTNNRMEIFAAIAGLEMLKQPCKVRIYSDSKYAVDAMMAG